MHEVYQQEMGQRRHSKVDTGDSVTPREVRRLRNKGERFLFVDVRTRPEWELAHIVGTRHLPMSDIVKGKTDHLKKDTKALFYSQTDKRSIEALKILRKKGFTNLKYLRGGIEEWEREFARDIISGRKEVPEQKTFTKRRVTLIRPAYSYVYQVFGKLPKNREIRPPLGLLYIAAVLEREGHEVKVIDAEPKAAPPDELYKEILATKPDIVGFTATTPEFPLVQELVKRMKKEYPKIIIMVGGAHVSALPRQTLEENPGIDYIICDEGELAALHIVNNLPKDERIVRMPPVEDMNDLPMPAKHLVDYTHYNYVLPGKGIIRMDAIESSRGCPFLCTFCFNRAKKPRYLRPERVVDEIERSFNDYGARFFMFFDDTFTVNKKHVLGVCNEIIRRGLNKHIKLYVNTRANTTDREMLEKMQEAGLSEISMGVESGNPEILLQIKKGTTHDAYEKFYAMIYDMGLQPRGSFIVGLPYETHETVRDTINFAKKIELMRASCNILTPYPGTEVYHQAVENEGLKLLCKDWRDFKRWGNSVVATDELTKEDLEYYQKRFLTEFYTQPKVLWYHVKQVLGGNLSYYFYRPLIFALRNRFNDWLCNCKAPSLRKK